MLFLLGRVETKFNRPLVGIELEVGIETLSRLGGHALHIDAPAFRKILFLLFAQSYALDFIGYADFLRTQNDDVISQAVDAHETAGVVSLSGKVNSTVRPRLPVSLRAFRPRR